MTSPDRIVPARPLVDLIQATTALAGVIQWPLCFDEVTKMSQKKKSETMVGSPALVHVLHGVHEHRLPVTGQSVLQTRKRLPYQLPYFAHAVVNGKPVLVHHVLQGGDLLTFLRPPGFKAAEKGKPSAKVEAKGLLNVYPELVAIANTTKHEAKMSDWDGDKIIDMMTVKVARWCEDHFGPFTKAIQPTLDEIVRQVTRLKTQATRLSHGMPPKKPGRRNTTQELADFADARHLEKTWKDISDEWNRTHSNEPVTHHKVRDAWRRRYGDKALPKNLRGE